MLASRQPSALCCLRVDATQCFLHIFPQMEFAPGEYIVRQNALADSYLVITKGEVLVVHTTPPQQQGFDQLGQPVMAPPQTQVVGNLSQSDSLGARGLFFGEPFQCSAVAGPNGVRLCCLSMRAGGDLAKWEVFQDESFLRRTNFCLVLVLGAVLLGEASLCKACGRSTRRVVCRRKFYYDWIM